MNSDEEIENKTKMKLCVVGGLLVLSTFVNAASVLSVLSAEVSPEFDTKKEPKSLILNLEERVKITASENELNRQKRQFGFPGFGFGFPGYAPGFGYGGGYPGGYGGYPGNHVGYGK